MTGSELSGEAEETRLSVLEKHLESVAIRQRANEVAARDHGYILRTVGGHLRKQILAELRWCINAKVSREVVALELEEQAAQLIDQVEHLARLRKTTDTTRH